MKIIDYIKDNCPCYALSYLVNGDASGLEEEDIKAIDAWEEECRKKLEDLYPEASIIFDLQYSAEPSFTRHPAFGLACDTAPCAFIAFVPNDFDFDSRKMVPISFSWDDE
jgi:hypothetical protein